MVFRLFLRLATTPKDRRADFQDYTSNKLVFSTCFVAVNVQFDCHSWQRRKRNRRLCPLHQKLTANPGRSYWIVPIMPPCSGPNRKTYDKPTFNYRENQFVGRRGVGFPNRAGGFGGWDFLLCNGPDEHRMVCKALHFCCGDDEYFRRGDARRTQPGTESIPSVVSI